MNLAASTFVFQLKMTRHISIILSRHLNASYEGEERAIDSQAFPINIKVDLRYPMAWSS